MFQDSFTLCLVCLLKFGGEVVIDWMHLICNLSWEQGVVPDGPSWCLCTRGKGVKMNTAVIEE